MRLLGILDYQGKTGERQIQVFNDETIDDLTEETIADRLANARE
jgi:hypothetical protein